MKQAVLKMTSNGAILSLIILVFCVAETQGVCDFQNSCSNIGISGNELDANCRTTSGSSTRSTIDLNSCIGNTDGNLVCGAAFANSCSSIQYQTSTTMSATCKRPMAKASSPLSLSATVSPTTMGSFNAAEHELCLLPG